MLVVDSDDQWEDLYQVSSKFKGIRGKASPMYEDWCELFGKYRAQGSITTDFNSSNERVDHFVELEDEECDQDNFEETIDTGRVVNKQSPIDEPSSSTANKRRKTTTTGNRCQANDFFKVAEATMGEVDTTLKQTQQLIQMSLSTNVESQEVMNAKKSQNIFDNLEAFEDLTFEKRVDIVETLLLNPAQYTIWTGFSISRKEEWIK